MHINKMHVPWVDSLRGIAIIAVVLGHLTSPLSGFIYSWHIPLFFFITGFLLKPDSSLHQMLKKDAFRLLLPYFIFGFLGILVELAKRQLWPGYPFIYSSFSLKQEIIGLIWWMDYLHLHHYGFVLWFLPALFWAKLIHLSFLKILKNKYFLTLTYLGILLAVADQSWILPFGLDKALIGIFWMSVGWLVSGKSWLFTLSALLFLPVPGVNIALKSIDTYGIIYSLLAINTLIGLVKLLPEKFSLFRKFGRHTMFVLVTHPYLNNIVSIITTTWFDLHWLEGVAAALAIFSLIVSYLVPIQMVAVFILKHNPMWKIPWITLRAIFVIAFQAITGKELVMQLSRLRKIILFPGCVVSHMFLYTDVPDEKELSMLRNAVDKHTVFMDIGANVGSYSVLLSDLTKHIFAFEPSPLSFERCRKNCILNGVHPKNIIKTALSSKTGTAGFTNYGGSSTINHLSDTNPGNLIVPTDTIDNWVKNNISNTHFNLVMKIDVEGHELEVIKGAKQLFKSKKVKFLILEIFDKNSPVFSTLKSFGYEFGIISGNNYYVQKI